MSQEAFVYTELQVNVPFDQAPWREINSRLEKQPGILSKTWLSGIHTNTVGGLYGFDTIENARKVMLDYIPTEAANFNCAFYTRIFDASEVEEASRPLHSPFFV